MSVEIEAKMKLDNVDELEARLKSAGGKRGPLLHEVNTFFDTRTGSLKAADQGLRVRVEQEIDGPHQLITITHKGPRAHGRLKSRSETEVKVEDAQKAGALLSALGYSPVLSFEKHRRRWLLDDCHIDIDTLPYLGHFVEIEGPSDQIVMSVREKLALGELPMIRASYIALMMTYLTEHHIASEHISFDDDAVTRKRR